MYHGHVQARVAVNVSHGKQFAVLRMAAKVRDNLAAAADAGVVQRRGTRTLRRGRPGQGRPKNVVCWKRGKNVAVWPREKTTRLQVILESGCIH